MKFYSGFSFANEQKLFEDLIGTNPFIVVGFSYGAIQAFRDVLSSSKRVDKLILISPAFFQNMSHKEKKLQNIFFGKDPENYLNNFYKDCIYPLYIDISKYKQAGTKEELKDLLEFIWDKEEIQTLVNRGVKIEIYLGEKDKILAIEEVKSFFEDFATIFLLKNSGHVIF